MGSSNGAPDSGGRAKVFSNDSIKGDSWLLAVDQTL